MEGMAGWMKWAIALAAGFLVIALGFKYAEPVLKTFFVLNCLVLIFVVLLQSGKAADLAGAFGGAGSQTAFGPRGAANILSKATTWCAVMFMVCAMALVLRTDKAAEGGSILEKFSKPAPVSAPAATPGKTAVPPVSAPVSAPPASQSTPQPAAPPAKKP
jgi:preprotein translocase subunit SecG